MNGMYLMDEINGTRVTEPALWRCFVQELHIGHGPWAAHTFNADVNPRPRA
jgi:hypothetical protein